MRFVPASVLLTVLISGIKTEAEPLTGTLGGPISGSGAYKDASVSAHDYIQAFHHGGNGGLSEGSSQIQDQQSAGGIGDQVPHGSAVPHHVIGGPGGGANVLSAYPGPYVLQKSDLSGIHFGGGRAISSPPFPYYPSYYGKTYASPYYSQYQPNPYQAAVYQPQPYYAGAPAYQYSGSPYSPAGVGAGVGYAGGAAAAVPYSSPVTPYSAYPYNYPYIPQYYPGYPSAAASGSYYQSSGAEIQSASKQ